MLTVRPRNAPVQNRPSMVARLAEVSAIDDLGGAQPRPGTYSQQPQPAQRIGLLRYFARHGHLTYDVVNIEGYRPAGCPDSQRWCRALSASRWC